MTETAKTHSWWRSAVKFVVVAILTFVLNYVVLLLPSMSVIASTWARRPVDANGLSALWSLIGSVMAIDLFFTSLPLLCILMFPNILAFAVFETKRQYSIAAGIAFGLVCVGALVYQAFAQAFSHFGTG